MKIIFDPQELIKELSLIRTIISGTKGIPGEDVIGLQATSAGDRKFLVAYAYGKKQWARITTPKIQVEEEGTVILNRDRFFKLLGTLKGETTLKFSRTGRAEIQRKGVSSKFTLTTSFEPPPRPHLIQGEMQEKVLATQPLYNQLKLCILDGELLGGGYKVSREDGWLEILVSDRLRLIHSRQKTEGPSFEFIIPGDSVRGVFEMLKLSEEVEIKYNTNITQMLVQRGEDGSIAEFGYQNLVYKAPRVGKILKATHQNGAKFEIGELMEAVEQGSVLADTEYVDGDFDFSSPEFCTISTNRQEGSASLGVDSMNDVEEEGQEVIRLGLGTIKQFLRKLKEAGAQHVDVQWGETKPVKWTPDFDDSVDIELALIMAPLQRHKEATKSE